MLLFVGPLDDRLFVCIGVHHDELFRSESVNRERNTVRSALVCVEQEFV